MMPGFFMRMRYMWIAMSNSSQDLNRRATVEQMLFDVAAGKRPLPDREDCRQIALYLGIRGYKQPTIRGADR
jgi:hypothetical protein